MFKKSRVKNCDEICYAAMSMKHKAMKTGGEGYERSKMPVIISNVSKSRARLRMIRKWVLRVGTAVTMAVLLVAVALVGMKLAGFQAFTVMSGSMEPDYPVGSLLYVRPVEYQDLKVGDVISYMIDNENTIVTHRIVGIEVDKEDASVRRFKTKGDANALTDARLVHYKNVLGMPVVVIPFMGYFAHNIQQPPGIYIVLVVGTLLLAWTFLPGTLEGRRKTASKSVA